MKSKSRTKQEIAEFESESEKAVLRNEILSATGNDRAIRLTLGKYIFSIKELKQLRDKFIKI